jgi:hypothetical protein
VDVGNITDFSKAHAASIISVEVSKLDKCLCIYRFLVQGCLGETGQQIPSSPTPWVKIDVHNKHLPIVFSSTLTIETGYSSETSSTRYISTRSKSRNIFMTN